MCAPIATVRVSECCEKWLGAEAVDCPVVPEDEFLYMTCRQRLVCQSSISSSAFTVCEREVLPANEVPAVECSAAEKVGFSVGIPQRGNVADAFQFGHGMSQREINSAMISGS